MFKPDHSSQSSDLQGKPVVNIHPVRSSSDIQDCLETVHRDALLKTMHEYDEIAPSYTEAVSLPDIVSMERKRIQHGIELVRQRGSLPSSVLDVGCAGSRDLETWTQKGITYYGVDYSAKMIELSIAKAERIWALACHFKRANLLDMEIVPASVSLVWCSSVIQHVPKGLVSNVLTTFHDALEPGGILYLNVRPPKEGVPIEGMVTSKEYTRTDGQKFVERFVSHYEMNEMTTLLERIGFTVEGGEMYAEVYNQYNDGGEKAAYLPEKFVIFARRNNVIA